MRIVLIYNGDFDMADIFVKIEEVRLEILALKKQLENVGDVPKEQELKAKIKELQILQLLHLEQLSWDVKARNGKVVN